VALELGGDFEAKAREAMLDSAEATLASAGEDAVAQAEAALRDFADQYDVGPLIDALEGPTVTRDGDSVTVRWRCTHPAAGYFEFGTPDNYQIDGDPILSFVWTDPPQWVREEFDPEGDGYRVFFESVDSGEGIAETRFTRWSVRWLRWRLETGTAPNGGP
jgi:hypothetical protein